MFWLFFGHAAHLANLSNFHHASINLVHQTRLTFDLEMTHDLEITTISPLHSGQGHMSVGDSAEEFILIHAMRDCLCFLWSSVQSAQNFMFGRWDTMESFCICLLHTSRQV